MNEDVKTGVIEEIVEVETKKTDDKKKDNEPEKKYTDAEVDALLNAKFAKFQADFDAKQKEAEKLAKMNAEEKAEHNRKQLEKKLAEYEAKENLNAMGKEASKMLVELELQPTEEVLVLVVKEDAEGTRASVKAFADAVQKAAEQIAHQNSIGVTPKVTTNTSTTITREAFNKMTYAEQAELAAKNPEEFRKITGGH